MTELCVGQPDVLLLLLGDSFKPHQTGVGSAVIKCPLRSRTSRQCATHFGSCRIRYWRYSSALKAIHRLYLSYSISSRILFVRFVLLLCTSFLVCPMNEVVN
jgi:hypothetical protein